MFIVQFLIIVKLGFSMENENLIVIILFLMIIFPACVATAFAQYATSVYPTQYPYAQAEHTYAAILYNFEYSVDG